MLVASADFEPSEIQNLAEAMPQLLDVKAKANVSVKFHVRIEVGDGRETPSQETADKINAALKDVRDGLRLG